MSSRPWTGAVSAGGLNSRRSGRRASGKCSAPGARGWTIRAMGIDQSAGRAKMATTQKPCIPVAQLQSISVTHLNFWVWEMSLCRVVAVACATMCARGWGSRAPHYLSLESPRLTVASPDPGRAWQTTGKAKESAVTTQITHYEISSVYRLSRSEWRAVSETLCKDDLALDGKTGARAGTHIPAERPRAPSFRTRPTPRNTSHNK